VEGSRDAVNFGRSRFYVGNRSPRRKGILARQPSAQAARCSPIAWNHICKSEERAMNWDRIEGNWKQLTGKVKEQWGKLTEDDMTVINGNQDQLVGRIQERYGVAKDEAERQVKTWVNRM
jgi:uncharacterized protein YjbJ (UPF0337 family)